MKLTRSIVIAIIAVSPTLYAQGGDTDGQKKDTGVRAEVQKVKRAPGEHAGIFYKAFFLERGRNQFREAIRLYTDFIAKDKQSSLAGLAARRTLNLLNRVGMRDQAEQFRQDNAELLKRAPQRRREGQQRGNNKNDGRTRQGRNRGQDRRRQGDVRRGADVVARLERVIVSLEKQLAKATESGESDRVDKLSKQLDGFRKRLAKLKENAERRKNDGDRRPGKNRRDGVERRPRNKALDKMSDAERTKHLEQLSKLVQRLVNGMKQRGEEDAAERLLGFQKKYGELVGAGSFKEAMALRQKAMRSIRRR